MLCAAGCSARVIVHARSLVLRGNKVLLCVYASVSQRQGYFGG